MVTAIAGGGYDPLPTVLFSDDFDDGLQGWTGLIGNYEDTLDAVLPPIATCADRCCPTARHGTRALPGRSTARTP